MKKTEVGIGRWLVLVGGRSILGFETGEEKGQQESLYCFKDI